ncbi:hypothetical protein IT774_07460 [Salinimonas marina]|uniref:Homeodomain-like domain-containing protein n=1 Tax=Salinimonas marina TaxID=2785918 RepID=A0A7S9HER1_9ALTE|nr:hypothetical protein [Salinimonas marina]QPG06931.1 hypothetical protein IT774_07460 [Salinimonas marina]
MNRSSPLPILRKPPLESDKKDVIQYIADGKSDSEIAMIYGVTKDTIWSRRQIWRLESGSAVRERQNKDALIAMWTNGYTPEEMSHLLGLSIQVVYAKLREYRIRDLPRMGIDAPTMSLASLRQGLIPEDDETITIITHKRIPKWVMVPVEQYQDLQNGTYQQLREQADEV